MNYSHLKKLDAHIKAKEKIYRQKPLRRRKPVFILKTKQKKTKRLPAVPYIDIAGEFSTRRKQ